VARRTLKADSVDVEEFLEWADEDTLAGWVDGEVIMHSPAGNRHQNLADFLVSVLRPFVELHQPLAAGELPLPSAFRLLAVAGAAARNAGGIA